MKTYLPYIASVVCAIISGVASYLAACRQAKTEINKLVKQHELDIEKEREKFKMEKEKMEIEHRHQLDLKQKDIENQMSADFVSTLTKNMFVHQLDKLKYVIV